MIGELNPIPFQVGGDPSRLEANYYAFRKMVGTNGYSADEDSIEAEWRKCRAIALTALSTFDERAANQAFPQVATDHIPLFETQLGIQSDPTASDEDRRRAIVPDYTGLPEAWWSAVESQVQAITPLATLFARPIHNATVTMPGRAFEQYAFTTDASKMRFDPSGQRTLTEYPMVSDLERVNVLFDIGNGIAPTREQLRQVAAIEATLNDVLPAWVDHTVVHAIGFVLDTSLLDATGFGL